MSFSGIDQTINCKDCKNDFVFSTGEQRWYSEHNLDEPPKRCRQCRELKKARNQNSRPQPVESQRQPAREQVYTPPQDLSDEKSKRRGDRRRQRDDDYEW